VTILYPVLCIIGDNAAEEMHAVVLQSFSSASVIAHRFLHWYSPNESFQLE